MPKTANQDRAAVLTPLIRGAFSALARVIAGMDATEVRASLQRMATDPAEVLIWENARPRAWRVYDAGGPLGAERIELTLAPGLAGIGIDGLLVLLGRLAESGSVRVLATPEPWRFLVRGPGSPRVTIETCPTLEAPEDLMVRIMVGPHGPAERLFKPGWLETLWKQRTAQALQAWLAVNQARPLSAHPAFAEVVEAPALGMPGVYLVRTPPLPYAPLLPMSVFQNPVSWAVVETEEELPGVLPHAGCVVLRRAAAVPQPPALQRPACPARRGDIGLYPARQPAPDAPRAAPGGLSGPLPGPGSR